MSLVSFRTGGAAVAAFCLAFTHQAAAVDIFVSPTGSAAAPGTLSSPTSFDTALASLRPGDRLLLRGGTYVFPTSKIFDHAATAAQPIFVGRAVAGEVPIVRTTSPDPTFLVSGAYITFQGLVFDGNDVAMEGLLCTSTGTDVSHDITILECDITKHWGSGLRMSPTRRTSVRRCHIYQNGQTRLDHGIYAGAGDDITIEDCSIWGNRGWGVHAYNDAISEIDVGFSKPPDRGWINLTVRRNRIHGNGFPRPGQSGGNEGSGIVVSGQWDDPLVENNFVYDNATYGLNIESFDPYPPRNPVRPIVRNNTFYGNRAAQLAIVHAEGGWIVNNICDNGGTAAALVFLASSSGNTSFDFNFYAQAASAVLFDLDGASLSFVEWRSHGQDANSLAGQSPGFVDAGQGNLHLSGNSPAIDRGTSLTGAVAADDIDGLSRPQGAAVDMGADEVSAAGWRAGAVDMGNGWKWLPWFGYYFDAAGGWIYHAEHGFMYPVGTSIPSAWFWHSHMGAWLWTGNGTYPFLWSASRQTWLWYYRGTGHGSGGFFHNVATAETVWL